MQKYRLNSRYLCGNALTVCPLRRIVFRSLIWCLWVVCRGSHIEVRNLSTVWSTSYRQIVLLPKNCMLLMTAIIRPCFYQQNIENNRASPSGLAFVCYGGFYMEEIKVLCSHCGAEITEEDYETVDGEIACISCVEHHAVICDR